MSIIHTITAPNGAPCGYFRVMGFEFRPRDSDQLKVQVGGWVAEADALGGALPVFNWYVELSPAALNVAQPIPSLETALTTVADSPWAGGTVVPTSTPLEEARTRRWALIKQMREEAGYAHITVNGYTFDADRESQAMLMKARLESDNDPTRTEPWTLADNSVVVMTRELLLAVNSAINARFSANHHTSRDLYAQIAAAQTVAELEIVSWPVPTTP